MDLLIPGEHRLVADPLGLILSFEGDETKRIGLGHLPCPAIVEALARSLLASTNADGEIKTLWTAKHYRNTISRFSRWLHGKGFEGNLRDLTVDHLYGFAGNETKTSEWMLRGLLRESHTLEFCGPLNQGVVEYLDGNCVSTVPRSRGHHVAYTRPEYDRIISACKQEILDYNPGISTRPDRGGRSDRDTPRTPGTGVAFAFRILLGLETGIPSEGLERLRLDDIRREGERDVRIQYRKRRGHGAEVRNFHSAGPWGAIGLIDRWLALTATARNELDSDRFWLCSYPDASIDVVRFSEFKFRKWRQAFIARHKLVDDSGSEMSLDLSRLRTTYHVRKQKAWNGSTAIDPNHSPRIEGDDYLTASADADDVADTVASAQKDLLRRASLAEIVTAEDGELSDLVDNNELLRLQSPPSSLGSRDMFGAICRDPYSSPFTPRGQFCQASVWTCLVCPLAVITTSKLPALLLLKEFLEDQAAGVSQAEWIRVYAPAWVQLTTRILPAFSETAIQRARSVLDEAAPSPLPIGPNERSV
ncbi:hypothetical protein [Sinomonas sp. RB5]